MTTTRWPGAGQLHGRELAASGAIARCGGCTAWWAWRRAVRRSQQVFLQLADDPVKNGGALVDFGCYNALWSLWYLGAGDRVRAVEPVAPKEFPKSRTMRT